MFELKYRKQVHFMAISFMHLIDLKLQFHKQQPK